MTKPKKNVPLHIYSVLLKYESPEHVVKPRAPSVANPVGNPGNPSGRWVRSFLIAASTGPNADKRAREELATLDPKAIVTGAPRVKLVPGASHEPSPDLTIEIAGKSFTYKQPGCPDALRGD
jgi:hypothetical protein